MVAFAELVGPLPEAVPMDAATRNTLLVTYHDLCAGRSVEPVRLQACHPGCSAADAARVLDSVGAMVRLLRAEERCVDPAWFGTAQHFAAAHAVSSLGLLSSALDPCPVAAALLLPNLGSAAPPDAGNEAWRACRQFAKRVGPRLATAQDKVVCRVLAKSAPPVPRRRRAPACMPWPA